MEFLVAFLHAEQNADGVFFAGRRDFYGLEAAFENKSTISGTVTEAVKGGLRVDIGVRAFMPASRSGVREMADLPKLIGQQIECRITKLDKEKDDVVVDRRVILEEQEKVAKQAAFEALQEGAVVRGTVRSLTDFGAFVDIGGVDGLLHVSDMSYARGVKPSDVVKAGDQVEAVVLEVKPKERRISLGIKQLEDDPWTTVANRYSIGSVVEGRVRKLTDFGAFLEIEEGVDGLVHVSDISWTKRIKHPSEMLKKGQVLQAVILNIDAPNRRLSLALSFHD